jgi:hypothetical protein
MSAAACTEPVDLGDLLAYWLGELDEAREAQVEEHLLGCGACADALDALLRLGVGVRDAFTRGAVAAVLSPALVQRLLASGYRLREYRVPANGSVNCTAGPEDDLVVARLQAALADVTRLDLIDIGPDGIEHLLEDVPFDAAAGEVVLTPRTDLLKRANDHLHRMRLVDAGSRRVIGEYAFVHAAWRG